MGEGSAGDRRREGRGNWGLYIKLKVFLRKIKTNYLKITCDIPEKLGGKDKNVTCDYTDYGV